MRSDLQRFFVFLHSVMRLTEEFRTILLYARDEAMRTGCYGIGPEHLLLGVLRQGDNPAIQALVKFGLEPSDVKQALDSHVFRERAIPYEDEEKVNFTRAALNVTSLTIMEAIRCNQDVSAIHLLAALCDNPGEFCCEYLHSHGVSLQVLRTYISKSSEEPTKNSSLPGTEDMNRLLSAFYQEKEIFS